MINIEKIRQYREEKIRKKMEVINDFNNRQEEKKLILLGEMNSSDSYYSNINFPFNNSEIFDIKRVRAFRNKKIQEKIKENTDENFTNEEKELKVLVDLNTSQSSDDEEEDNNISSSISELSTMSSSFTNISDEKKNYWIKYNLYDIKIKDKKFDFPVIYQIDKEKDKNFYLYTNKLITYNFVQSAIFGEKYSINNDVFKDINYNDKLGFFFCGKNIELKGEEVKKCCPNEMMCKECMKKNINLYNLIKNFSININGRAARKNRGAFHCFGHFLVGNQIENCVDKFSCQACKLLDKYENYYFSDD